MAKNLENPNKLTDTNPTQAAMNQIVSTEDGQVDAQYFWCAIKNIGGATGTVIINGVTSDLEDGESENIPVLPNGKPYGTVIRFDATGTTFKIRACW